jgi:hypothetical protein
MVVPPTCRVPCHLSTTPWPSAHASLSCSCSSRFLCIVVQHAVCTTAAIKVSASRVACGRATTAGDLARWAACCRAQVALLAQALVLLAMLSSTAVIEPAGRVCACWPPAARHLAPRRLACCVVLRRLLLPLVLLAVLSAAAIKVAARRHRARRPPAARQFAHWRCGCRATATATAATFVKERRALSCHRTRRTCRVTSHNCFTDGGAFPRGLHSFVMGHSRLHRRSGTQVHCNVARCGNPHTHAQADMEMTIQHTRSPDAHKAA